MFLHLWFSTEAKNQKYSYITIHTESIVQQSSSLTLRFCTHTTFKMVFLSQGQLSGVSVAYKALNEYI